ncbi:MAG: 6-carboxytetrahydropterin synthase QueD [Actinomycetota bacterium]|nr:6-carboxytetrahydropterin synthase QueD [Actinomycetota bacterium]
MRTRITRLFTFEAAHRLEWHAGRCKRLHGHHYQLEVTLAGTLDDNGVIMDFDEMDALVTEELISRWDHEYLNDILSNPTAERLASEAWLALEPLFEVRGVKMESLRLWETPRSMVELLAQ